VKQPIRVQIVCEAAATKARENEQSPTRGLTLIFFCYKQARQSMPAEKNKKENARNTGGSSYDKEDR